MYNVKFVVVQCDAGLSNVRYGKQTIWFILHLKLQQICGEKVFFLLIKV